MTDLTNRCKEAYTQRLRTRVERITPGNAFKAGWEAARSEYSGAEVNDAKPKA